jgi:hypothetical protein
VSTYRRDEAVLWRASATAVLIRRPQDPTVLVLDGLSGLVWSALEQPRSRDQIIEVIAAELGQAPEEAAALVTEALRMLETQHRLVAPQKA